MTQDDPSELAADDAAILALESDAITGHTLKLLVLEPSSSALDLEAIRARVMARLDAQPRARQRVDTSGDRPRWVDAADFDIANHVRRHPITEGATHADLLGAVDALMSEHLDRSHPLWTLDIIGPLADGREAIAARIHHAMADGIAGVRFLHDVLFDPHPEDPAPSGAPGIRPERHAGWLTEVRRMPAAVHRELGHRGSASPLDRPITGARELAFTAVALADMKAVGADLDDPATVNDVLLAIIAGGLREWFGARDVATPRLRAQIPVSLHHREEGATAAGNRDSFLNIDLPLGEDDPVERLKLIRAQTRVDKQRGDAQEMYDLMHALGRMPAVGGAVQRLAGSAREFSLSISNVPGPAVAVGVDDRRVEHLFSSSEPAMHHALRVSAISCDGFVGIGLCSDPQALPGMPALADAIDAAFVELRSARI